MSHFRKCFKMNLCCSHIDMNNVIPLYSKGSYFGNKFCQIDLTEVLSLFGMHSLKLGSNTRFNVYSVEKIKLLECKNHQ